MNGRTVDEIVHYQHYDQVKYRSIQDILRWMKLSRASINEVDSKDYSKEVGR